MVFQPRSTSKERQPLLSRAPTPVSFLDDATTASDDEHVPPPLNQFSTSDVCWILAGLWSAVFLGALDGKSSGQAHHSITNSDHIVGTIVATLMTPIGSYFNRVNQSSYIGTSYLLSVCCFTPLYGKCAPYL